MNIMHAKYKIFLIQNTKYFIISDLFNSMLALKQAFKSAAACLRSVPDLGRDPQGPIDKRDPMHQKFKKR